MVKVKLGLSALALMAVATAANAAAITSFTNLNFDAGVVNVGGHFDGFDDPVCEIAGWTNKGNAASLADSGVEASGAWWLSGYPNGNAAFMQSGDGAFNLSNYTIQAGDKFTVDFSAWGWTWQGNCQWTVTLFSGTAANVLGTYTTGNLTGGPTEYNNTATPIAATDASVGGKLGVLFESTGASGTHACLDTVTVASVPEPASLGVLALGGLLTLKRRRAR